MDNNTVVGTMAKANADAVGLTLIEAVTQALRYEMEHDGTVVVFGEDVAKNGGVFRATSRLFECFGGRRVFDTPLSESMIAGVAVGMALEGLKPVAEIQFMGFIYPIIEQMECHAGRFRNRTRGKFSCPLVIRSPHGGGIHAPEHHSESREAMFAHIPGIRVVIPSSPRRAYGLLLAAIRDPDPVIFLEPTRLYRSVKEDVPDDGVALPLDTSFVLSEGMDITLVSWGASVHDTISAAKVLAKENVSAEVIDVATLGCTFDMDTILASVEKTGCCAIIHEAQHTGGFGAEIAARLADRGVFALHAPVARVTGYDTHMPYYRREKYQIPDVSSIVAAANRLLLIKRGYADKQKYLEELKQK